jgi:hypothetical protein
LRTNQALVGFKQDFFGPTGASCKRPGIIYPVSVVFFLSLKFSLQGSGFGFVGLSVAFYSAGIGYWSSLVFLPAFNSGLFGYWCFLGLFSSGYWFLNGLSFYIKFFCLKK